MLPGTVNGDIIARIGVPHHARGRVVPEDPSQAAVSRLGAIANNDHACMLRITHANTSAVMQ